MADNADISAMVQALYSSNDLDETLSRVVSCAVDELAACDFASVTTIENGRPVTRASTHEIALAADALQYAEGEGPCLDAATRERWVLTPDVLKDSRWPRFSSRLAAELSVHSMLAARLCVESSPERSLGSLNLYSSRRGAFDDEQRDLGLILASVASVAGDAARTQTQLQAAIQTRSVIGEAIGILRVQSNLSSEAAFEVLSRASQRMNIKLRDVAAEIVSRDHSPQHSMPGRKEIPGTTA